jgi:hypothetical protein
MEDDDRRFLKEGVKTCLTAPICPLKSLTFFSVFITIVYGRYSQYDELHSGFVTTSRVTHATPAALYAKSPVRNWECDVPKNFTVCKDIARQLIEDYPGNHVNVSLKKKKTKPSSSLQLIL